MAAKPLPTAEQLRQFLKYDPQTGKLTWRKRPESACKSPAEAKRWNANYSGKEAFATVEKTGYLVGAVLRRRLYAHRVIWALVSGEWPAGQIDHINGVRTDNRLANLRVVTSAGNNRNRARPTHNTSGTMGVTWQAADRRWQARLGSGRDRYIGAFETYEEAVKAREDAQRARGYHPNHGR